MKSRNVISRTAPVGKAVVSAAREASVDAGLSMLDKGGNAVDAGIAAAFVAGVIEPMETTLAGSGFMLVDTPDDEVCSIEFGPRAPIAAHASMFTIDPARQFDRGLGVSTVLDDKNVSGGLAAGVPATLKGLVDAHERYGRLPLKTVLEPAIQCASDGFDVDAYFTLEVLDHLHALRADPGARDLFLVDDMPPLAAHLGRATLGRPHIVRQATLASTLERIAEKGADEFYGGALGTAFLETHRERGGILSHDDLIKVQTSFVRPRHFRFRDVDIWAPRAPCGAITQLQILGIWQAMFPDAPPARDSAEQLTRLASASWHAFADRYHWLGDPEYVPVPESGLLSGAYAAELSAQILSGHAGPRSSGAEAPWTYFARHAAHNPWRHEEGREHEEVRWAPEGGTAPTQGTTHISVIDEAGMSVSITHTAANHCGSKVVCQRTGLLLDAAMGWFNACPNAANSIAGGKRPLANMGPVLLSHGRTPFAALGAPGGRRIINAVVQIILNLVEKRMTIAEACAAPRIDASGSELLASERLKPLFADAGADVQFVEEEHEGYSYELARPVAAVKVGAQVSGCTDPFSKGYSGCM